VKLGGGESGRNRKKSGGFKKRGPTHLKRFFREMGRGARGGKRMKLNNRSRSPLPERGRKTGARRL